MLFGGGDVDDVVDRAKADDFEARLEPSWALFDADTGDSEGAVERTGFAFERDLVCGGICCCREFANFDRRDLAFGKSGQFASDASMAKAVGSVGRDLEFEDGVGGENIDERFPHFAVFGENEEAIFDVLEADFRSGTEHAL